MMIPKQNPESPAPVIEPSCCALKLNSLAQLSKMPPRIAKPTPAAKIAMKPAHKSRWALGTMGPDVSEVVIGNDTKKLKIGVWV